MSKQSSISQVRDFIRYGTYPDSPTLIDDWLAQDRCCLMSRRSSQCSGCSYQVQREAYEQQFRLLLEAIMDELNPRHWRCTCLNNIFKPLFSLQNLAYTAASKAHVKQLYYELSTTVQYTAASLNACYE
jgi:hypothetical protein